MITVAYLDSDVGFIEAGCSPASAWASPERNPRGRVRGAAGAVAAPEPIRAGV
ncbi:hypothetical protein [Streptomyces sp. NPDC002587]